MSGSATTESIWEQAVINDDTTFAFLDSGPPSAPAYTTVVCIHGHSFHARTFARLLPLAPALSLRIVALNRRDYLPSSTFSPAELAQLNDGDDNAHELFLADRALELARFLVWLVRDARVCPRANANSAGGLAILGWSLGNVFAAAFLRHLAERSYPPEIAQVLAAHFITGFIYEASYSGLGYPAPIGAYQPLTDPHIPERARGAAFGSWVSSYFSHPCYTTQPAQEPSLSSLQLRTPEPATKRPTIDTLAPHDLLASIDRAPDARSERAFWLRVRPAVLYANTDRMLRLPESETDALVPPFKLCVIYCRASVWSAQWAVSELERDLARRRRESALREVEIVSVEGANHFLHYEEPERFLRILADAMSG